MFILDPSYNQPKFSSCAMWNSNAITFANSSMIGATPADVFVSNNNTIYVTVPHLGHVLVWIELNSFSNRNISTSNNSYGIFVSSTGDVFVDNSGLTQVQ